MDKRRLNMQRYNALRSARVTAMLEMLKSIDFGAPELDHLTGREDNYQLEDQLNTYRAQLVAQYFGVNVSKGKLLQFAKPKNHVYSWTAKRLMNYITNNHDEFMNYWDWFLQPKVKEVLDRYDN